MTWRDLRRTYEFLAGLACVFFRVPFWAPYARWTTYPNWWQRSLDEKDKELIAKMRAFYLACDFKEPSRPQG